MAGAKSGSWKGRRDHFRRADQRASTTDPFGAAIHAVYEAAFDPSEWPAALQAIADCLGDVGALLLFHRDGGQFGYIESTALDGVTERFFATYPGEDLRATRGLERGVFLTTDVVTDRDVVSQEEILSHPFYLALAGLGLRYFATVPICHDYQISAGVAVQRSIAREPFCAAEMRLLGELGRHVERAFRLSVRLINAEIVSVGLGEALNRLRIGVVALDSFGRIAFSNPAAQKLLGDPGAAGGATLVASPEVSRAIQALISGAPDLRQDATHLRPHLLNEPHADRRLTLYILPAPSSAGHRVFAEARAILLIIDHDAGEPPDPDLVRDALGLTLGEARVAALVGSGAAPRVAAAKLGVTEETARTVLKRVFGKLGISRQSELSTLLTRLVLR